MHNEFLNLFVNMNVIQHFWLNSGILYARIILINIEMWLIFLKLALAKERKTINKPNICVFERVYMLCKSATFRFRFSENFITDSAWK